MLLNELFPDLPKITFNDIEYEIIFDTRSMIQLYRDYPEKTVDEKEISSETQILEILNKTIQTFKMNPIDMVNFLHAGLQHTKTFNKEKLMDVMKPCFFHDYMDVIIVAYQFSQYTPEQVEKMEVMAATNKSKKKLESETLEVNMPISELNVD